MRQAITALMLSAIVAGSQCSAVQAQDAERAFFQDKTIRLVVGYSPGGGYDVYARMIAPYLKKYIGASLVVENKPGAGGITALNGVYVAPPDGLQIMLVKGNAATMAQLTGQAGVRYDLRKIAFLGGTGAAADVVVVGVNSPIKTVKDLMETKELTRWAATGPMDGLSDGASLICESFSIKCKVILGYRTTNDVALALARGEADAMLANDSSAKNYVDAKSVRAIATMSSARSRYFPDLPTVFEIAGLTAKQRFWFDFRTNVDVFGRVLVGPAGMSAERVAFLQDGVRKALTDPELVAEGARTNRYVDYQDAKSIQELSLKILDGISGEDKQRILQVVQKLD